MIAPIAALLILVLTIFIAIDLVFQWSNHEPVHGRQVIGVCLLVLLLTWRIAERVLTGTL